MKSVKIALRHASAVISARYEDEREYALECMATFRDMDFNHMVNGNFRWLELRSGRPDFKSWSGAIVDDLPMMNWKQMRTRKGVAGRPHKMPQH